MSTHPPYTDMDPRHFGTLLGPEDLEPLLAELALPDHAPMPVLTALGACLDLRDRLGAGDAIGTACGPAEAVRMVRAVVEAVTLLTATEPWVVPYTVQLAGEYVLEILTDLRYGYRELLVPGSRGSAVYGRFVVENPEYFARTERRVVSYWNAYHRLAYASFQGYPGGTALDLLRDAASEGAGRPWPNRTPGRRGRLDGYG
ncbi:hypothetical protein [Kitasatospora sp. NPDC004289]